MATNEMWPEVLELRGDQDTSFIQHQERTLLTTNQHQNQVSFIINEDSSKDSSKILIELSEEEFFTITNSETRNHQNRGQKIYQYVKTRKLSWIGFVV